MELQASDFPAVQSGRIVNGAALTCCTSDSHLSLEVPQQGVSPLISCKYIDVKFEAHGVDDVCTPRVCDIPIGGTGR